MKKILQLQIFQFTRSLIVALLLVVGLSFAYAWTGPTAVAPGNNTDAPINVSTTSQVKAGGLWLNALGVTKNAIIGKVQLDDVVVEGTTCGVLNPDGTISRNVIGETLACVSGIWTKVGGSGSGSGGGSTFVAADITIPATGTYDFNSYLPQGVTPTAIQVSASVGDNAGTQCCSHSAKLTVDGKVVSGFHRYTNNTGSGPNGPVTYEDWSSLIVTPGTHTVVYTTSHGDVPAQFKITGYFTGSGSGSSGGRVVGEVFSFVGATCPTGSLLANGSAFSGATYPDLRTILGGTTLPDLRGEFIRGLDNGRGVDAGRTLLSSQLDAFQGHWHSAPHEGNGSGNAPTANTTSFADNIVRDPVSDGVHGVPRTASETRPRNIALTMCIVATGVVESSPPAPPLPPPPPPLPDCLSSYTTPGSYTCKVPGGSSNVSIKIVGGGGGAGGPTSGNCGNAQGGGGGGGGSGAYTAQAFPVTPGDQILVTVGSGGTHGTGAGPINSCSGGLTGASGNSSSVQRSGVSLVSVAGGSGGTGGTPSAGGSGGAGGSPGGNSGSNGNYNYDGGGHSLGGAGGASGFGVAGGSGGSYSVNGGNGASGSGGGGGGSSGWSPNDTESVSGKGGDGRIDFVW